MAITLHHGDCLDVLKKLPPNSVDAIVTDPPYGLSDHDPDDVTKCLTAWVNGQEYLHKKNGFMGKFWDSWVPGPEVWREAIRVIKPGGYLLAFAGTRTMDLMSIAIRLGGFELQERISSDPETPSGAALLAWVYGSGMPKSHNVGKAIEKLTSIPDAERKRLVEQWIGHGTGLKPSWEPIIVARKPLSAKMEWNVNLPEWESVEAREGRLLREISRQTVERDIDNTMSAMGIPNSDQVLSMFDIGGPPPVKKEPVMASGAVVLDRPSRFFYCGKAGVADRDGSKHPTVKPVALMRHLVRLVTPPGGVVMDPFAGSGTTGAAAIENGVDAILIEREDQYANDIRNRFVLHMKD
jgi:site-specific DNA-methyltransferase (adenine-specific)